MRARLHNTKGSFLLNYWDESSLNYKSIFAVRSAESAQAALRLMGCTTKINEGFWVSGISWDYNVEIP